MKINIIAPNKFCEVIEQHPKWELDLGRAYTKKSKSGDMVSAISDKFVLSFYAETSVLTYKVGRMGAMSFYNTHILPEGQVWIYIDDFKSIQPYQPLLMQIDNDNYIGSLIAKAMEEKEISEASE